MKHSSGLLNFGIDPVRYEIVPSVRRRTVSIEVHADLRVVVRVPSSYRHEVIARWVSHRSGWIARQLERFRRRGPPAPPPRYVDGEAHAYLGNRYPLRLLAGTPHGVRFADNCIGVRAGEGACPERVAALLHEWYFARANDVFHAVLREQHAAFFARRGHGLPPLVVKAMKRRWGSLSPSGRVALNVDLIRVPRRCIELVVAHELCHLEHANHGKGFYRLLEEAMPDWKERKALLLRHALGREPAA